MKSRGDPGQGYRSYPRAPRQDGQDVTLCKQAEELVGEVRGNLRGLLHMEDEQRFGSDGAGREILFERLAHVRIG